MKRGAKVWVCYDGKFGRRVPGVVIQTKQTRIKVKFTTWTSEKEFEEWFPKRPKSRRWGGPNHSYGKFVKESGSLMDMLFGSGGDWYAVYKRKKNDKPAYDQTGVKNICSDLHIALLFENSIISYRNIFGIYYETIELCKR